MPSKLSFIYTYDGIFQPKLFTPVMCLFRERDDKDATVGHFRMCTLVTDVELTSVRHWIDHNSISSKPVYPFAYLDLGDEAANQGFLDALAKFKTINFNIKVPY